MFFPLSIERAVRMKITGSQRNQEEQSFMSGSASQGISSGSNKSYYANHFDPQNAKKKKHFVSMFEVRDNYSNVMGLFLNRQFDINCLGVKSCSKCKIYDTFCRQKKKNRTKNTKQPYKLLIESPDLSSNPPQPVQRPS